MASVRVSCQTIALYTGSPVVLSQTSAVSRWLVMPTAAMSAAFRSALASAPATTERTLSQISVALCSTQPAFGKICSCSFWSTATTRPDLLKIMQRLDVVPWSIAATYCSAIWFLSTLNGRRASAPVRTTSRLPDGGTPRRPVLPEGAGDGSAGRVDQLDHRAEVEHLEYQVG